MRFHSSWIVAGILISWSMARLALPILFPFLSLLDLWLYALAFSIGVAFSSAAHEAAHALVRKRMGAAPRRVSLFVYGGVYRADQKTSPRVERAVALAGPTASLLLAGSLQLAAHVGNRTVALQVPAYLCDRLAALNFLIAALNLFPATPLDGGRIFTAALDSYQVRFPLAEKIPDLVGRALICAALLVGNLAILRGTFIAGIFLILLGILLDQGLREERHRASLRRYLRGHRTGDYMRRNPVTVSPSLSVDDFAHSYLDRFQFEVFPVVSYKKPVRAIYAHDICGLSRDQRERLTVGDVARTPDLDVTPETDVACVLEIMERQGTTGLVVADHDGKLAGVVTLPDLLSWFAAKIDLSPHHVNRARPGKREKQTPTPTPDDLPQTSGSPQVPAT